ncbi:calcineurin-like phosphoesterase C-terminal domain-containing protein, partial [Brevibacterium sediminis]|uniref:calcineurin-like phosphoesterase C-terminal domain-containing protein n=1 Tax=Brevibacterium sediminis TaxID=1857024 RepID=UPI003B3B4067
EYYTVRNEEQDHQFLTGINSPTWRTWAEDAQQWQDNDKQGDAPEQIDPLEVAQQDVVGGGTYLTTSFFGGSTGADVQVTIDGETVDAEHTQPAEGKSLNKGWEYTETVTATNNLSSSGNVAQASPHVWRATLPDDLTDGEHTVEVKSTDRYGRQTSQTVTFTVTEGNQ